MALPIPAIIAGLGILKDIVGIGGKTVEDKDLVNKLSQDENIKVLEQFAKEFQNYSNRTWWDSLIDGLNRLPRPLMSLGIIGFFIYIILDPAHAVVSLQTLELVPEWLSVLFLTIVGFYFGSRMLSKDLNFKPRSSAETMAILQNIQNTKNMVDIHEKESAIQEEKIERQLKRKEESDKITEIIESGDSGLSDKEFKEIMEDESKPMTSEAIAEWHIRQKQK